ncbi:hypothetical protein J6590_043985 [Homalodisca vitripennis]|nr:hypothetical protein J6590_043985 [Homalodisca vitripennis]
MELPTVEHPQQAGTATGHRPALFPTRSYPLHLNNSSHLSFLPYHFSLAGTSNLVGDVKIYPASCSPSVTSQQGSNIHMGTKRQPSPIVPVLVISLCLVAISES